MMREHRSRLPGSRTRATSYLHRAVALLSVLLLALTVGCGVKGQLAGSPVYTVDDLERRLALDPGAWLGQPLLVQGRLVLDRTWSAPDSVVTRIELLDAHALPGAPALSVRWGGGDPIILALRRIPLLGRLARLPQTVRWGTRATYRVRLAAAPGSSCTAGLCFEAVLLDAAPELELPHE